MKGRAPKTGYDRAKFGKGWKDPDRNGCDARNDILSRDLVDVTYKSAARPCVVLSGRFDDPYTGKTIEFTRGQGTSTAVQIDHVVALSDSWQKGAQGWDADTRLEFANDPLNLLASDGPTNAAKGDKDAASWLPPNKSFRCDYVSRQTQVKAKYGVWMTKAEHAAIGKLLNSASSSQAALPASIAGHRISQGNIHLKAYRKVDGFVARWMLFNTIAIMFLRSFSLILHCKGA